MWKGRGREVGLLSEPRGVVGLSEALIALREELLAAWQEGEGEGRRLRFRVHEPIVWGSITRSRLASVVGWDHP
jgi:hypothetical protein